MAHEDLTHPHCPLCLDKGKISYLRLFQINMDEAVYNCESAECVYPYGVKVNAKSLIVARKCVDMSADSGREGKASHSKKKKDDAMSTLDDLTRLVDLGLNTDAPGSDFECNLEDILEFIGDASPSDGPGVTEGSSVVPGGAIG